MPFPDPNVTTEHQVGGKTWTYDGDKWVSDAIGIDESAKVLMSPDMPDPADYDDGTLWTDEDTYDLFVLSGGQWIDLTAMPNMSDYVKDSDLQFILAEYLRKRDAFDQYYQLSDMLHVIQPNGTFKLHLGTGAELDNIITRLIDAERDIIHLQGQIDNLGGDGETPPDANHPGGQYVLGGALAGAADPGHWYTSYALNSWNQVNTFYISEVDVEGDVIEWADHVGDYVQVHRYIDNPHTGADFSVSAVFRINSVNDLGNYDTLNVSLEPGTDKGQIVVGDYFTFEIIEAGRS